MERMLRLRGKFFRVSHSAHRWLFHGFGELKSGPVGGTGTALN
jgi:hypothetical protein